MKANKRTEEKQKRTQQNHNNTNSQMKEEDEQKREKTKIQRQYQNAISFLTCFYSLHKYRRLEMLLFFFFALRCALQRTLTRC